MSENTGEGVGKPISGISLAVRFGTLPGMDFTRLPQRLLMVLCLASCCIFSIGLAFTWMNRNGMMSPTGVPLGADLLQHHEAARFAHEGSWSELYRDSNMGRALYARTHSGETRVVGGFNYVYPPLVAWVAGPFAGLDYLVWVACWQLAILAFYILSHRLLAPWRPASGINWIVAMGLPVFYYGVILAQNSSLSLLVVSASALLLSRGRPWAAGFVLSCLFYKPQIGLAIAGFLFLAGQWPCALAFGFGSLAWLGLGWVLCGQTATLAWFEVLLNMLGGSQNQVSELHQSLPGTLKVLLGRNAPPLVTASVGLAGMGIFAAIALMAGWMKSRRASSPEALVFLAPAAWTLFSPYVMHYDLLLAVPWWWWNLKQDLGAQSPGWIRTGGLVAASSFWLACLLSINPGNLPITPAVPFLAAWFSWTVYRLSRSQPTQSPA